MIPAHLLNSNKFDWTHVYLKRSNAYHLAYLTRFYSPHTHKRWVFVNSPGGKAKHSRGITVSLPWLPGQLSVGPCETFGGDYSQEPIELWKSEEIWCQVPVRFSNLGRTALELLKSTQWDKSRTNSYSARLVEFQTSGYKTKLVMYPVFNFKSRFRCENLLFSHPHHWREKAKDRFHTYINTDYRKKLGM